MGVIGNVGVKFCSKKSPKKRIRTGRWKRTQPDRQPTTATPTMLSRSIRTIVGHNGHYSHNPRVVTVVTVVSGGRFLVTGHNPRVVTSYPRAICRPSKKEGKEDRKGGLVPPIHNPPEVRVRRNKITA
eukprot:scaffold486_cov148-Skeletonema_dohrnii-CCMP3373.AAC.26